MRPPAGRRILLLLALLSSPLTCCGSLVLLDAVPAALLPPALSFIVNVFEAEARVENWSGERLFLTPFATTSGQPVVITQFPFIRQRDIPLEPGGAIVLTYDAADMPLAGIAVCRTDEECRWVAADGSRQYRLESFEDLPALAPAWLLAIQSQPQYDFGIVLIPLLSLLPVVLFSSWLYLGRSASQRAAHR